MKATSMVFGVFGRVQQRRTVAAKPMMNSTKSGRERSRMAVSSFVGSCLTYAPKAGNSALAVPGDLFGDVRSRSPALRASVRPQATDQSRQAVEQAWLRAERWLRRITWLFVGVTILVDLIVSFGPTIGWAWGLP
jgi:hypothetical protein